jgi:polyisoprenoid-binding protein YceI
MPKLTPSMPRVDRCSLPPAGAWHVHPRRSSIAFSGRANRLSPTVRASFGEVRGSLQLEDNPNHSRVDVFVDVRAVTTGNPLWDDLLRAADPLRARDHPVSRYASTAVRWTGAGFEVDGTLELAGALTPLQLRATVTEIGDTDTDTDSDSDTNTDIGAGALTHVALNATGVIDPRAAHIRLDLPGGRLLMPRQMTLTIAVVATRSPMGQLLEKPTNALSGRGSRGRRFALAS